MTKRRTKAFLERDLSHAEMERDLALKRIDDLKGEVVGLGRQRSKLEVDLRETRVALQRLLDAVRDHGRAGAELCLAIHGGVDAVPMGKTVTMSGQCDAEDAGLRRLQKAIS